MKASLKALLTGLIDYAGLFPPAKLPLEEALANYLRYRESEDAWMLGRFICPASRLKEIPEGITLSCSAIGRGGTTVEAFLSGVEEDLAEIQSSGVRVDVLETKLPSGMADAEWLDSVLERVITRVRPSRLALFLEPATFEKAMLTRLLNTLADYSPKERVGFKIRAGGLVASAFPSSQQLAFAIHHAIRVGIPIKATAGLHHPFPRFEEQLQARMHGFLNVFGAGIIGCVCHQGEDTARAILEDDDPAHFRFEDDRLYWADLYVSTSQIAEARKNVMLSFGSCSFDEPRDDLRALGWR
jgi:hypothetical protein